MIRKNKFKVRSELKNYVRNILSREGISHRFKEEGELTFCLVPISGERFHKIVKRAYCEQQTDDTGILHLTYEESQDPSLCQGLMTLFKQTSFVVVGTKKEN